MKGARKMKRNGNRCRGSLASPISGKSYADCMEGPEGIQRGARSHSHIKKALTDLCECCSRSPEENMKIDIEPGNVC